MKFFFYLCLLLFELFFCKPADPNFRTKPLQNTEYTGFISRNFFQAVVEVPLTKDELTILEERKSCFQDAIRKRDLMIIPILKQVAMENKWNERERELELRKESSKEKENKIKSKDSTSNSPPSLDESENLFSKKGNEINKSENPLLNRGEFAWFLDGMFIYKEDYSNPEKCSFVFRNIQDNLFARVEKTKLSYVGEDKNGQPQKNQGNQNNPGTNTSSPSPLNTGIPQTGR